MELEKQVCSLQLADRLKELGVKQESAFYWIDRELASRRHIWVLTVDHSSAQTTGCGCCAGHKSPKKVLSTFTVPELGEIITGKHPDWKLAWDAPAEDEAKRLMADWIKYLQIENKPTHTEADARAKFLIFLIEEKLLTKANS